MLDIVFFRGRIGAHARRSPRFAALLRRSRLCAGLARFVRGDVRPRFLFSPGQPGIPRPIGNRRLVAAGSCGERLRSRPGKRPEHHRDEECTDADRERSEIQPAVADGHADGAQSRASRHASCGAGRTAATMRCATPPCAWPRRNHRRAEECAPRRRVRAQHRPRFSSEG